MTNVKQLSNGVKEVLIRAGCKIGLSKMDTDELPVLDPNVDFRQVPPIHQKRIIAFVNHFIMRTVSFLNTFAASCESRMMSLESKIERLEASLLILESQLESVPCLKDTQNTNVVSETQPVVAESDAPPLTLTETEAEPEPALADNTDKSNKPKASEDPRFIRFFKMIQFGVPPAAVKLKMEVEGFDPSILDKPDSVVPGYDDSLNSETN